MLIFNYLIIDVLIKYNSYKILSQVISITNFIHITLLIAKDKLPVFIEKNIHPKAIIYLFLKIKELKNKYIFIFVRYY